MLERSVAASLPTRNPTVGFAASLFAACCQILLLATISLAPLAMGTDPAGQFPICHANDGTEPAQQPGQPAHDCVLCVLCLAQATPLALLSPVPMLSAPHTVVILRPDATQSCAPPIRLVAAQPRGPPFLI
jgi:hypothetical protein